MASCREVDKRDQQMAHLHFSCPLVVVACDDGDKVACDKALDSHWA